MNVTGGKNQELLNIEKNVSLLQLKHVCYSLEGETGAFTREPEAPGTNKDYNRSLKLVLRMITSSSRWVL